jgi:SAM-dependent methyltransferase
MDHHEAGRYWEENAASWTLLARQGWDVYRDLINTPAFFRMLPDVAGLTGLDIGCGEGHNTRLLAGLGASVCAIDISPTFLRHAHQAEQRDASRIRYAVASGQQLPFPDAAFDFATACMSLMDMPQPDAALCETFRVLRPQGFLQFSITHPCFDTPHRRLVRDSDGNKYALEVARYFDEMNGQIDEWLFSAAPQEAKAGLRPFRVPRFHRTLFYWINSIRAVGFQVEQVAEPRADDETAARFPAVADTQIVAYFLHLRCRKLRRVNGAV